MAEPGRRVRRSRRTRLGAVASLGLALLASAACGPPRTDRINAAVQGSRARLEDVRNTLRNAARVLPATVGDDERGCFATGISPVVGDLRPTTSRPGNLDILMVEDVEAPWAESRAKHPMARSSRLAPAMAWVLDGKPIDERVPASHVESVISTALGVRYVLLFRVLEYNSPRAVTVSEFTGGTMVAEHFLVDLESRRVLCILPCTAKSGQSLYYFRPQGQTDAERVANFQTVLDESLYGSARADAYRRLELLVPGSRVLTY